MNYEAMSRSEKCKNDTVESKCPFAYIREVWHNDTNSPKKKFGENNKI